MILQAILAVFLAVYISRMAKRELDKRLEAKEPAEAEGQELKCTVKVKQNPAKLI
jgi:hypothetical protein